MEVAGKSDVGKVRKINEDCIFLNKDRIGCLPNLFIIADGMGGHNAGEMASRIAIDSFVEFIKNQAYKNIVNIEEVIINGIDKINKLVYNKSLKNEKFAGMGTTFLVATLVDSEIYIGNVGDSRLYFANKNLKKITTDHSLVEEMLLEGKITKNEADNHPKKNIITRAVGVESNIKVDIFHKTIEESFYILMCSDGLTNMIKEDEILEYIKGIKQIDKGVEILVDQANKNGGYDNISVILIKK